MASSAQFAVGLVLTALSGAGLTVQTGMNAAFGAASGSKSFAAAVSMFFGLASTLAFFLLDSQLISKALPTLTGIKAAPWWSWVGGCLGAFFVICGVLFAYILGAGTSVAVCVAAQLLASIVCDLTGFVGFPRRGFSWQRIVGAVLLCLGVWLITAWPGELKQPLPPADELELGGAAAKGGGSSGGGAPAADSKDAGTAVAADGLPAVAADAASRSEQQQAQGPAPRRRGLLSWIRQDDGAARLRLRQGSLTLLPLLSRGPSRTSSRAALADQQQQQQRQQQARHME